MRLQKYDCASEYRQYEKYLRVIAKHQIKRHTNKTSGIAAARQILRFIL